MLTNVQSSQEAVKQRTCLGKGQCPKLLSQSQTRLALTMHVTGGGMGDGVRDVWDGDKSWFPPTSRVLDPERRKGVQLRWLKPIRFTWVMQNRPHYL